MKIGRKIYYDKKTGDVLVDTGEREGSVTQTKLEDDILTYKTLSERNKDSFGVVMIEFGRDRERFAKETYRVNPATERVEFTGLIEEKQGAVDEFEAISQRQQATEALLLELIMKGMV